MYGGAAGGGKALCENTLIPTPNGWKELRALEIGDLVFGADGKPIQVLAISEVMQCRECWRLTFDDGSEIVADADHQWVTFDAKELTQLTRLDPAWRAKRRAERKSRSSIGSGTKIAHSANHRKFLSEQITARNRLGTTGKVPLPKGTIRITSQIAATLQAKSGRANHAVKVCDALDIPDAFLPIDPYIFGLWLGDGNSGNAGFTSADQPIIDFIRACGWPVKKTTGKFHWSIGTVSRRERANGQGLGQCNDFAASLRSFGVLGNKHVPMAYLRGSRSQRLAILQGLMDTDGTVAKNSGSAEFTNTNRLLAEAVVELACSLGHKASMREGVAKLNGRVIGPKWTVKWMPPEIVFRLPRKAKLQRIGKRRTCKFRYVAKCEKVDSVPVKCIRVSASDGMFLAGPTMIPTHNSSSILMSALQFVEIPKYAAIIFRRTYADLALPGALMDRAFEWLGGTDAKWESQEKTWRFPAGSTLSFGYLDSVRDRYRYQSSEFQTICFDELTQFKEQDYLYLFSRLRRTADCKVPLRMRAGTNPGGLGHAWVKKRFISETAVKEGRVFVPAKMHDNKYLDIREYEASLNKLDSFTRRQLKDGDWSDFQGKYFFPSRWPRYADMGDAFSVQFFDGPRRIYLRNECTIIIGLDWALNKRKRRSPGENPEWATDDKSTSDFNAFVVCALTHDGNVFILDCVNERIRPEDKAPTLASLCRRWRPHIVCGDDDMLSETLLLDCRRQRDIPEIRCLPLSGRGKAERAMAAIIRGENGLIFLPEKQLPWLDDFTDSLTAFTGEDDEHDDIPDALGIIGRLADELKGDGREEAEPDLLTQPRDLFAWH